MHAFLIENEQGTFPSLRSCNCWRGILLVCSHCSWELSLAVIFPSKCSCEQIWTLGGAFICPCANVQAHTGLHTVIEPWTMKMSAPVNNNALDQACWIQRLHFTLHTCCIGGRSATQVYLWHTASACFSFDCGLWSETAAQRLISLLQSAWVRLKATRKLNSCCLQSITTAQNLMAMDKSV